MSKDAHVLDMPALDDATPSTRLTNKLRKMKQVFQCNDESVALEDTFLYVEIKCVISRLRLIGALPIQQSASGEVTFNFLSCPMLYCVCAYLVSLPLICLVIKGMVERMRESLLFYETIFPQLFIVLLVSYLALPVSMWLDAKLIAKYFNDWATFQKSYLEVTKKRLKLTYKMKSRIFTASNVVTCLIGMPLWMVVPPYLHWHELPTFYINSLLFKTAVHLLWKYSCNALCKAGDSIAESFKEDLEDNISAEKIGEYKLLWLKLAALTEQFSYCAYHTYTIDSLSCVWFITSSLYGSIACLKTDHYGMLLMFLMNGIFAGLPFVMICHDAHEVPRCVTDNIQLALQNILPSTHKREVWKEVKAFLQVIASHSPVITYGGYVQINRHLLQKAGAAVVTYLIVLVQFQISLSEHYSFAMPTLRNITME